jgi:DNA-binding transcriptional regulator YiaG
LEGCRSFLTIAGVLTTDDLLDLQQAREMARSGVAKIVRQGAGLSLREMGEPIEASASTILRWERGERRPTGPKGAAWGRQLQRLMKRS